MKRSLIILMASLALAACTNGGRGTGSKSKSSAQAGKNTGTSTAVSNPTPDAYKISVATISSASGDSSSFSTTILFDASKSASNFTDHCTVGGGSQGKPCDCVYSWTEQNTTGGTTVNIARSSRKPLSAVQSAKVDCPAPEVYGTEIIAGTQIRIKIERGTGNTDEFEVPSYIFTKGGTTAATDFITSQGQMLNNIMRYTCYEEFQKGLSIRNKFGTAQQSFGDSSTRSARFPIGTQFCAQPASSGGTTDTEGCDAMDFGYSAQSAYYSLYIKENDIGNINPRNGRYVCPKVRQGLVPSASGDGKYYPLDSSFALSASNTGNFNVGVDAFTKLSNGAGDPNSVSSACAGTLENGGGGDAQSFVRNCLGFAARPNPDGSCSPIKDAYNNEIKTYRLRRFVALYPMIFNTNGFPIDGQSQATDTVYALDRPVAAPAGSDASATYTMAGPKPCPFAYFDRLGVTGARRYASTNADAWVDRNIDGIMFPSSDSASSCRATFPVMNRAKTQLAFLTPAQGSAVHVRGVQPWSPHYEEDTSFRACAPQSNPLRDPPLHFAKTSNLNVAYCAEVYPTQNEYLPALLAGIPIANAGSFQNFTSHVIKGTATPARCQAYTPALESGYPSNGFARHPAGIAWDTDTMAATCDRSVMGAGQGGTFMAFPLLATPAATEAALRSDPSYQCSVTFDGKAIEQSKVGKQTPSGGCCGGVVRVASGNGGSATTAHLEVNESCQVPTY
jgi:hypothetical protein